jgi:hypothetical protein
MLSDSLLMVQAIKSGLRIFLTVTLLVAIFLESRREHRFGDTIKHPMPIWLYAIYLIFGAASLLWTSSFSDSVLQWLMDAEGFVFAWLFIHLLGMYRHRHPGGYFDLHKVIAPAVLLNGIGFLIGMYVDPDKFYRLTHGGAVSRLGGFIINPNELGMLLVIGVSCFLPLIVKEGKIRISIILYLLMLIQMLLLTGSRSSFIALVAVLMVLMRVFAEQGRSRSPVVEPGVVVELLVKLAGFSVAMVVLGVLMTMATPFLRDEENPWSQMVRMAVAILVLPFV